MAYQNKRGIPLAHGAHLRNGQIISPAPTVATASSRPSAQGRSIPTTPGMRSRTVPGGFEGARPKNSGVSPTTPGMRNRTANRE